MNDQWPDRSDSTWDKWELALHPANILAPRWMEALKSVAHTYHLTENRLQVNTYRKILPLSIHWQRNQTGSYPTSTTVHLLLVSALLRQIGWVCIKLISLSYEYVSHWMSYKQERVRSHHRLIGSDLPMVLSPTAIPHPLRLQVNCLAVSF